MDFKSLDNKYLIVKPGVQLTIHLDPVIHALDEYFKLANLKAYVTSGLRTPEDQLRIIQHELTRRHIAGDYQEAFDSLTGKTIFEGEECYNFAPAWSRLLNLGYIINPPFTAKCLMDYYRPGSTANLKGKIIGASPHQRGRSFDISGGANGIKDEAAVIQSAVGKVKGLRSYLLERNNNAIHVDVDFTDMTQELKGHAVSIIPG